MKMINNFLYKKFLPKILQNNCGERIPRSGESGKKVNCYIVNLDLNKEPYSMLMGIDGDDLKVLKWTGKSFEEKHTIKLSEINKYELLITHYYGLSEVFFDTIFSFAWHNITKIIYLKIKLYRFINSTSQFFFNKKKLVTKKRMELLQFMLNEQISQNSVGIDMIDLMTKLYSIRWALHPSATHQRKILELYIDSLIKTGELEIYNDKYKVTGNAISTLEKYEEDERRHTSIVKLQLMMVILTIIIILIGILQTGLIKLPTLIDWSDRNKITNTK